MRIRNGRDPTVVPTRSPCVADRSRHPRVGLPPAPLGAPSGEALTRAAANVVDDLADRTIDCPDDSNHDRGERAHGDQEFRTPGPSAARSGRFRRLFVVAGPQLVAVRSSRSSLARTGSSWALMAADS
jgi:hypothetical protein